MSHADAPEACARCASRSGDERYQALDAFRSDLVLLLQPDSRIAFASHSVERLLGLTPDAAVGQKILHWAHPDDAAALRESLAACAQQPGQPLRGAWRLRHASGTWRWFEAVHTDQRQNPALGGIVGNYADVTEEKQLSARMMQLDRMVAVGTLAAGVAHEINNPLAYVIANVSFAQKAVAELLAGRSDPAALKEIADALGEADEGAQRVRHIVRDLKTFSRSEEDRLGPVDVVQVLESSISMAQSEIRHRAALVRDFSAVPPVLANDSRLGQVFLNLLVNAAQAIPEGAADRNEIQLSVRGRTRGPVVVEIRDTGCGIPEGNLKRIFDPFFTTKPVGEGTGLGLAICSQIINTLGGTIEVESVVGRGTSFRVGLPVVGAVEPRPGSNPPLDAQPRCRILAVDDEPFVLRALQRLLAPHHEVHTLASAREALAAINGGERYDVIFCDMMMPELGGIELFEALQASAPDQATVMVFITGGAFTARAREFLDSVANPRCEKPFTAEALRAAIDAVEAQPSSP